MSQQSGEIVKLPPFNSERRSDIDIKHIDLELRFDWVKKQAIGKAEIILMLLNSTDKFTLDAGMLTVNSIKLQDGNDLVFEYDGGDSYDNLKISLDKIYNSNEEVKIIIDYHTNYVNEIDPLNLWGSYGKGIRFFEPTSNDPGRHREIWSMGEPEGNRYWFPCFDSPNDLRTTGFTATVENNLTVISNGILVSEINNPDGTKTFHWRSDTPYPNYLTSFVAGEYIDVKQNFDDIELHNYGYPEEKADIISSVERLPDMMKYFSELTGLKYPYPRYSQVFVQEMPGGMENFMASTITENMVDDHGTHADFFYLWDGQEAHVLAGQWFGACLSPANWVESWLNESFSRYLDEMYSEYKNGHDEVLLWYRTYDINTYLWDWNSGIRRPVVTMNYENSETLTRDNYSFVRGAMVLHMLRKYLGEDNWLKAIRHYVKSNYNKLVTTSDFIKAIKESTGENMDWFFDEWIYKMGHPVFEVTKKYDIESKKLFLNVKQTQKPDPLNEYPQTEYFKGKMDIEIDGKIENIWIEPKAECNYSFSVSSEPKIVNFDFESTWIKELTFNRSLDELIYIYLNDIDILARNSAMSELSKIAASEKTTTEEKEKIFSAFRNVINSNSYWRLRNSSIAVLQNMIFNQSINRSGKADKETIDIIMKVITKDSSWTRSSALRFLGMTLDPDYADLYIKYLNDPSDRVINAAAVSLAKTKSQLAFNELVKLMKKPSMKSQCLLSALSGFKELGDKRAIEIAYSALSDLKLRRWRLPTPPVWDYRIIAAETIAVLGGDERAFNLIFERLKKAIIENDNSGIFNNVLLIIALKDPRGIEAFKLLKEKFRNNNLFLDAVNQLESQFLETVKK